eukprot:1161673-Pelagomonas_calceolata.AAC.6
MTARLQHKDRVVKEAKVQEATEAGRMLALALSYLAVLCPVRVALKGAVIVIVMDTWEVVCYDHNLKLLWKKDAPLEMDYLTTIKEVGCRMRAEVFRPQFA